MAAGRVLGGGEVGTRNVLGFSVAYKKAPRPTALRDFTLFSNLDGSNHSLNLR